MSTREDLSGLSGAEFDLRSSGFTGSPFPLSVLPVIHAELPTSAFIVTYVVRLPTSRLLARMTSGLSVILGPRLILNGRLLHG
jgi:hypothetical protein